MAFREKSAWISVITMLAVYGYYFSKVLGGMGESDLLGLFVGCVVVIVVVQIVLNIVAAIISGEDAKAPVRRAREAFRAEGHAQRPFRGLVRDRGGDRRDPAGPGHMALANGLFFTLIVADLTKATTQIVYYRRDA